METYSKLSIGTRALIFSKLYYGVLSRNLEKLGVERYFSIIRYIHDNKGCCQQDICNAMEIDKTAMVKVLNVLSKNGMIERQVNPRDRREHFIMLSKTGEKRTKEIIKVFNSTDAGVFEGITEHEKTIFTDVLSKLTQNLKQMPANDLFFHYKKTKHRTSK